MRCGRAGLKGAAGSVNPDDVSASTASGGQRVAAVERAGAFWPEWSVFSTCCPTTIAKQSIQPYRITQIPPIVSTIPANVFTRGNHQ